MNKTHQICNGIKVTCSFTMNCNVIICIHVRNWLTQLQPEWQTLCHNDDPIFTVIVLYLCHVSRIWHWCYCIVDSTSKKCLNELFVSHCTACTAVTVEACKDKTAREKMNSWFLLLWQPQPPCWHVKVIQMYSPYTHVRNMLILTKRGLLCTKGIVMRILNSQPWDISYTDSVASSQGTEL